jgi:HD-GYP domain-containing protein (c-di-GMP phosphodiesterase class II)
VTTLFVVIGHNVLTRRIDDLQPGDVLGDALHASDGSVLLRAGVTLDDRFISAIRDRGFLMVTVRDGLVDDLPPSNIVSQQVRAQVASTIGRLSCGLNAAAVAASVDDSGHVSTVGTAVDRMGERELPLDQGTTAALAEAQGAVVQLIDEVLCAGSVGSLESLKTHNEYTFQHSVDVAITGALLGNRLGLDRHELEQLVLGCLVHDLGKMFIDVAILDKPGALTEEERAQMQRHPRMGFEIIRRVPMGSILPAHVAYQHHERQDGAGYPRGLVGRNRVTRTEGERLDGRSMTLIAEIAAVADVYSALTSDRPYRAALSADVTDGILAEMGGSHLNSEIVATLRRIAPLHPVGTWVEVVAGPARLRGWRGVVTDVVDARRPEVRLVLDPAGEARDPLELDCRQHDDVRLRSLPVGVHPAELELAASSA